MNVRFNSNSGSSLGRPYSPTAACLAIVLIAFGAIGSRLETLSGNRDGASGPGALHDLPSSGSGTRSSWAGLAWVESGKPHRSNSGRSKWQHGSIRGGIGRGRSERGGDVRSHWSGNRSDCRSDCGNLGGARCASSRRNDGKQGTELGRSSLGPIDADDFPVCEFWTNHGVDGGVLRDSGLPKLLDGDVSLYEGAGAGGYLELRSELWERNAQPRWTVHGHPWRAPVQQCVHGDVLRGLPRYLPVDAPSDRSVLEYDGRDGASLQCVGE